LCLSGEHPEIFFIANGQGRNGKGLINELAFKLLGEYAYKLSIEVLTKEVKKKRC
jgi:phage/plasmid-associated DNA primase